MAGLNILVGAEKREMLVLENIIVNVLKEKGFRLHHGEKVMGINRFVGNDGQKEVVMQHYEASCRSEPIEAALPEGCDYVMGFNYDGRNVTADNAVNIGREIITRYLGHKRTASPVTASTVTRTLSGLANLLRKHHMWRESRKTRVIEVVVTGDLAAYRVEQIHRFSSRYEPYDRVHPIARVEGVRTIYVRPESVQ